MKFILKTRTRCAFLIVALAFLPSTLPLSAQAIYGSIYGQVTDPSGAAIPNATITVSDESKGTSVQTTSNQSGEYTVPNLIPD
ncbi:MAG TPA: carboxypeptidase-like regulatory domain-containing protein, partial [Acidobacteriaceae bacterium]|nr:carboxypeptidase-like regulatory domain-containing protein [Acidobacteriaceae bacterium]